MDGLSMYAEAYWNLHKGVFSYRPPGGRVTHAFGLTIEDPKFISQRAGREKVRATGRKNVHAFVRGDIIGFWHHDKPEDRNEMVPWAPKYTLDDFERAYYNPMKMDGWETENGPILKAKYAILLDKKVWVAL
jgi:hypothetical protein